MNKLAKAGLGIVLIGLAFMLPEISFLGISFGEINNYILMIVQIGLILGGIGYVVSEDE